MRNAFTTSAATLRTQLGIIAAGGVTLPAPVESTVAALEAFTSDGWQAEIDAQIAEAIRTGDAEAVQNLLRLATGLGISIASSKARAVAVAVDQAATLLEDADAYGILRDRYNQLAAKLTEAYSTIDPDAPGDDIVSATAKVRDAWGAVPGIVAEMHRLERAFVALLDGEGTFRDAPLEIASLLTADGEHAAPIWKATFAELRRSTAADTTPGRGGRYVAALRMGIALRAPQDWRELFA